MNINLDDFFKKGELIPAIVQEVGTNEVLMQAYMNKEALYLTIQTKRGTYFSRSRGSLWVKGETSGHIQEVKEIFYDCDCDSILLKVVQTGPACHTGNKSCFYRKVED